MKKLALFLCAFASALLINCVPALAAESPLAMFRDVETTFDLYSTAYGNSVGASAVVADPFDSSYWNTQYPDYTYYGDIDIEITATLVCDSSRCPTLVSGHTYTFTISLCDVYFLNDYNILDYLILDTSRMGTTGYGISYSDGIQIPHTTLKNLQENSIFGELGQESGSRLFRNSDFANGYADDALYTLGQPFDTGYWTFRMPYVSLTNLGVNISFPGSFSACYFSLYDETQQATAACSVSTAQTAECWVIECNFANFRYTPAVSSSFTTLYWSTVSEFSVYADYDVMTNWSDYYSHRTVYSDTQYSEVTSVSYTVTRGVSLSCFTMFLGNRYGADVLNLWNDTYFDGALPFNLQVVEGVNGAPSNYSSTPSILGIYDVSDSDASVFSVPNYSIEYADGSTVDVTATGRANFILRIGNITSNVHFYDVVCLYYCPTAAQVISLYNDRDNFIATVETDANAFLAQQWLSYHDVSFAEVVLDNVQPSIKGVVSSTAQVVSYFGIGLPSCSGRFVSRYSLDVANYNADGDTANAALLNSALQDTDFVNALKSVMCPYEVALYNNTRVMLYDLVYYGYSSSFGSTQDIITEDAPYLPSVIINTPSTEGGAIGYEGELDADAVFNYSLGYIEDVNTVLGASTFLDFLTQTYNALPSPIETAIGFAIALGAILCIIKIMNGV